MDKCNQRKTYSQCFDLFSKDTEGVTMGIINGAHKFIAKIISEKKNDWSQLKTFDQYLEINIFPIFSWVSIKDYIFTRMTKSILLDLALYIIQEMTSQPLNCCSSTYRRKQSCLQAITSKQAGEFKKLLNGDIRP